MTDGGSRGPDSVAESGPGSTAEPARSTQLGESTVLTSSVAVIGLAVLVGTALVWQPLDRVFDQTGELPRLPLWELGPPRTTVLHGAAIVLVSSILDRHGPKSTRGRLTDVGWVVGFAVASTALIHLLVDYSGVQVEWRARGVQVAWAAAVVAFQRRASQGLRSRPLLTRPQLAWTGRGSLIGGAVGAPLWVVGALGSVADTGADLLAGFTFGLASVACLGGLAVVGRDEETPTRLAVAWHALLVGALAASVASAWGVGGESLLLPAFVGPSAAAAVAWADRAGHERFRPLLFGAITGTTVIGRWLYDVDELWSPGLLPTGEPGWWLRPALVASLLIAGAFFVAAIAVPAAPDRAVPRWPFSVAVAVVALGFAGHVAFGGVGLHGDRVLLVLAETADLSALDSIEDPVERRARAVDILRTHAEESQANLIAHLDGLGIGHESFWLDNVVEVEAGPIVGWWLGRRSDVARVLVSPTIRPVPGSVGGSRSTQSVEPDPWNLDAIGATAADRRGFTGEGIVVASIDSGVDFAHPELAGRQLEVGGRAVWLDVWFDQQEAYDNRGHGTHTLASAVGSEVGVAPGATWFGCGSIIRNHVTIANSLRCLEFAFAPGGDVTYGADVIVNSWDCAGQGGCSGAGLERAFENLRSAGVAAVVSAGNRGPECASVEPPATYAAAIGVGATGPSARLASFTSRGDDRARRFPDLMAPGDGVVSARAGGGLRRLSGTSMAAPHVAGAIAVMWEAAPELRGDVDATVEILAASAAPLDVPAGTPECDDRVSDDPSGLVLDLAKALDLIRPG